MSKIILVTGGFDPLHGGHIRYFREAKAIDPDIPLCVGINSDEWLIRKKGKFFMTFDERKEVISELKSVDLVMPFDDKDDSANDLISTLLEIYDTVIFANGGDRHNETAPEFNTFENNPRVEFKWAMGGTEKYNSSAYILKRWDNS